MKENFALRFNLHKCGFDVDDSKTDVFATIYGISAEEVEDNFTFMNERLKSMAESLKTKCDTTKIRKGMNILFIGDSITSDRFSFANILRSALDINCNNRAISGIVSTGYVSGMDGVLTDNPDIIHIMLGTNDVPLLGPDFMINSVSLEEYKKNMKHILECCKAKAPVIVSAIPPAHNEKSKSFLPYKKFDNELINAYNKVLRELAESIGCIFNDTHEFIYQDDTLFEPDGIHLSPKAHEIFAERLANIISKQDI